MTVLNFSEMNGQKIEAVTQKVCCFVYHTEERMSSELQHCISKSCEGIVTVPCLELNDVVACVGGTELGIAVLQASPETTEFLGRYGNSLPVIVWSERSELTLTTTAQFLGLGAKSVAYQFQDLIRAVRKEVNSLVKQDEVRTSLLSLGKEHGLIGESPAWLKVLTQVKLFSFHRERPILLFGASGTGKELVARMIHSLSQVNNSRFVAVNCATIRGDLVRSQLFGHIRGSFTGAVADQKGIFEEAKGGTILLDEIQALDPLTQAMLLRAIQEKKITPVGSNEERSISNVRLVAACNQPLEKLIEVGQFREDLYHRLNVLVINLPTLAERREDISRLAEYFLDQFSQSSKAPKNSLSADALQALEAFPWPGNVRELENTLIKALVSKQDGNDELQLSDLPTDFLRKLGNVSIDSFAQTLVSQNNTAPAISSNEPFIIREIMSLPDAVTLLERWLIPKVLRLTEGNQSTASEILDVTRGKIRERMKAFGIKIAANVS